MGNAMSLGRDKPFSVSQSSLNLLRDCARCFWFCMILGIKQPSGPMSTLPMKYDRIIGGSWNEYAVAGRLPPLLEGCVEGVPFLARVDA